MSDVPSPKRRKLNPPEESNEALPVSTYHYDTEDDEDLRNFRRIVAHEVAQSHEGVWGRTERSTFRRLKGVIRNSTYYGTGSLSDLLQKLHVAVSNRIFKSYTGETHVPYPKPALIQMLAARYRGDPLAHFSRREEDAVLEEYEETDSANLGSELVEMHGVSIPKEIVEVILSFYAEEYDSSLVLGFGLCNSDCYRMVLTTWRRLTLQMKHLYFISKVILRNVRHLDIVRPSTRSERWKPKDWRYVLDLVADSVRVLEIDPYSVFLKAPKPQMNRLVDVRARRYVYTGPGYKPAPSYRGAFGLKSMATKFFLNRWVPNLERYECCEAVDLQWLGCDSPSTPLLRLSHIECLDGILCDDKYFRFLRYCPNLVCLKWISFRLNQDSQGHVDKASRLLMREGPQRKSRRNVVALPPAIPLREIGVSCFARPYGQTVMDTPLPASLVKSIPSLRRATLRFLGGGYVSVSFCTGLLEELSELEELSLICGWAKGAGDANFFKVLAASPNVQRLELSIDQDLALLDFEKKAIRIQINYDSAAYSKFCETQDWPDAIQFLLDSPELAARFGTLEVTLAPMTKQQFTARDATQAEEVLRERGWELLWSRSDEGVPFTPKGAWRGLRTCVVLKYRRVGLEFTFLQE